MEERIALALDKMEQTLARVEAQYETLNSKVDRIIAAVEKEETAEVKAETEKPARKTMSPIIANLLAKSGVETFDDSAMERALAGLSVEQRIAVKAE